MTREGCFMFTLKNPSEEAAPANVHDCFVAGTGILGFHCESGDKTPAEIPIEDFKIGDSVFSPLSRSSIKITNTWRGYDRGPVIKITAGDSQVILTQDHPVFTPLGYIKAADLKDCVKIVQEKFTFESAKIERVEYDGTVYNLDTENNGAFLAGGIVVGTNHTQNEII
jgi:intein/homing endonuclease